MIYRWLHRSTVRDEWYDMNEAFYYIGRHLHLFDFGLSFWIWFFFQVQSTFNQTRSLSSTESQKFSLMHSGFRICIWLRPLKRIERGLNPLEPTFYSFQNDRAKIGGVSFFTLLNFFWSTSAGRDSVFFCPAPTPLNRRFQVPKRNLESSSYTMI